MAIRVGEVERDELLRLLAPHRVRNAQLLRWVQAGLLFPPRREGLGRGRGGASYYPAVTVIQARALAELLRRNRSLAEAGWRLWLIGYAVTPFARGLLLAELSAQTAALRAELARLRKGQRSRFVAAAVRDRKDPGLARVRKLVSKDGLRTIARMLAEQRLGTLKTEQYTAEDWANYQDVGVALVFPDLQDHPDLPDSRTIPAGIHKLTRDANLKELEAMVKRTDDTLLVTARNELHWLWEYFRDPTSPELSFPDRDDFLRFLRLRLEPDGAKRVGEAMKALGQPRVPLSPLERQLRSMPLQPVRTPSSPMTVGPKSRS
jgi:hypothetical protein